MAHPVKQSSNKMPMMRIPALTLFSMAFSSFLFLSRETAAHPGSTGGPLQDQSFFFSFFSRISRKIEHFDLL